MGLDQYVCGRHYKTEKAYKLAEHIPTTLSPAISKLNEFAMYADGEHYATAIACIEKLKRVRDANAVETIIDLRKANAIHNYFIQELWDGEYENCKETVVPNDVMDTLVERCEDILKHYSKSLSKVFKIKIPWPLWEREYTYDTIVELKRLQPGIDSYEPDDFKRQSKIDEMLETAAEMSAEYAENLIKPAEGFFFGEAQWDGRQFSQTCLFVNAMKKFQAQKEEGDYTLYTYDCWW